jgi:hypothetical protein
MSLPNNKIPNMKKIFNKPVDWLSKGFSKFMEETVAFLIKESIRFAFGIGSVAVIGGGYFVNKAIQDKGENTAGIKGSETTTVIEEPKTPLDNEAGNIRVEPKKREVPIPVKSDPFLAYLDKTRKKSGAKRSCAFLILKTAAEPMS